MARILIVDDDREVCRFLRIILTNAGHEAFIAEDGEKALLEYQGKNIEVVVTDLEMPNIHGLELITLLRDLSPRPAIIVMSGTGEPQLAIAKALGATTTIGKPIDTQRLLAVIDIVLATRE